MLESRQPVRLVTWPRPSTDDHHLPSPIRPARGYETAVGRGRITIRQPASSSGRGLSPLLALSALSRLIPHPSLLLLHLSRPPIDRLLLSPPRLHSSPPPPLPLPTFSFHLACLSCLGRRSRPRSMDPVHPQPQPPCLSILVKPTSFHRTAFLRAFDIAAAEPWLSGSSGNSAISIVQPLH